MISKIFALLLILALFPLPLQASTEIASNSEGILIPVEVFDPNAASPLSTEEFSEPEVFLWQDENPLTPAEKEKGPLDWTLSDDPYSGKFGMWGHDRVRAEQAWDLSRGLGVTIAVIDTGLDFNHEDIAGNIFSNPLELNGIAGVDDDGNGFIDDKNGWDFVGNDNNPNDDNGHGSHVAGIAAAVSDNGKGIAGVAPDAKILPIKVLNADGNGALNHVINGIRYAADLGAQVINMSLGVAKKFLSKSLLASFQSAVDYALGKGSIIVTAAGNGSVDTSTTAPAGLANTLAIGAIDSNNKKASFSNKNPDLVAPGVKITSLRAGGGYISFSGTSMASPYAAGAAALILSYYGPTYQNLNYTGRQIYDDIYTRLTESAVQLGRKNYDGAFGYGLLDVYGALTYDSLSVSSLSSGASSTGFPFPTGTSISGFGGLEVLNAIEAGYSSAGLPNWYQIEAFKNSNPKRKKSGKK